MATVITLPADVLLGALSIGLRTYDTEEQSDLTGHSDVLVYGHPRWQVATSPMESLTQEQAAQWRSIILRMRGKQNVLALFDPVNPTPRGTLLVNPSLTATALRGARAATVQAAGQAGKTLLTGDWVQIGSGFGTSQLVQLVADATLDGSGTATLSFEPYLRADFAAGTSTELTRPVCHYGLVDQAPAWQYQTNNTLSTFDTMSLLERFS